MISRIRGELLRVEENQVELRVGEFCYEALIPSYLAGELAGKKGSTVELFIHHYFEGGPGASALVPRLIGFKTPLERELFEQMIKTPGMGPKKVLKALVIPPSELARAIEREDRLTLAGLPGVGKRTAEKIIAALKGKLSEFAGAPGGAEALGSRSALTEMEEEAAMVLVQLGFKGPEAAALIRSVLKRSPELSDAESIVRAALRNVGSEAIR